MEKENKEVSILDQVKKAEKVVKTHLLMKQLSVLKDLAKQILVAKEETRIRLQELGISEEDSKKVIDFINSLPETQLSDEDKLDLRDKVKNNYKSAKQEIQRKIEESPAYFTSLTGGVGYSGTSDFVSGNGTSSVTTFAFADGGVTLNTAGSSLSLNV